MRDFNFVPTAFSVGENAYCEIDGFCRIYGERAVIIGGKTAIEVASEKILRGCNEISVVAKIWYGGECSRENISVLSKLEEVSSADMIFAVGGGKAIDVCKYLAEKLGKPVFVFPTVAAGGACCSRVSVLRSSDGSSAEPFILNKAPTHVFLDSEILSRAPEKYLSSGIGAALAEIYDLQISARDAESSYFGGMAISSAKLLAAMIFENGAQACRDNRKHNDSEAFRETLLAVSSVSGLVFGQQSQLKLKSGFAACFCSALENLCIAENMLHGEKLAFCALVGLLYDGQAHEYNTLKEFAEKIGLPTVIADLGATLAQLDSAADLLGDAFDTRCVKIAVRTL
jgi:glycerol dehydrogenase